MSPMDCICFLSLAATKIDHILGHKTDCNNFKRIEMIQGTVCLVTQDVVYFGDYSMWP